MVNVLHVTPFFPPEKGGIAIATSILCDNLSRRGVHVSVITSKRLFTVDTKIFDNIQVRRINSIYMPGWPYPTLRSLSIPLDCGRIIKDHMRINDIDIVHIHGHHYPISWIAANTASKLGIPVVLSLHGMNALNPNVLGGESKIEDMFNKIIFTKLLTKCTVVIGGTDTITNYGRKFGTKSLSYRTIPSGVNTKTFVDNNDKKLLRYDLHLSIESKIVLFVGRFEKVKGIIEFSKACTDLLRKFSNLEVVLVGAGSYQHKVESLLENCDRVHFMGWQPPDKIYKFFIASDFYVLPSRFEALPLTILEAMNAGLHILYTQVGGISDILSGYICKTLISEISSEEITRSLEKAIESECSEEDRKRSLAYARKFDWDFITSDIANLYREIL